MALVTGTECNWPGLRIYLVPTVVPPRIFISPHVPFLVIFSSQLLISCFFPSHPLVLLISLCTHLSINDLPNELLVNIFEYFSHLAPRPIEALYSLCLTSRRFQAAAIPFLYHTYTAYIGYLNESDQHLFAYTLVEQLSLAKHVRRLDLVLHRIITDRPWRDSLTTTRTAATAKLKQAVKAFRLPSFIMRDWFHSLDCADRQAFAAVIVFLASRTVEELCLRHDHRQRHYELFTVFYLATKNPTVTSNSFHNLKCLKVIVQDERASVPIRPLAFIFRLPSLRHFEAHGYFDHELGASPRHYNSGPLPIDGDWYGIEASPIESMILRDVDLGCSTMSLLIRTCKALRRFELEAADKGSRVAIRDYQRPDAALLCHVNSLESLCIEFSDESSMFHWGYDQYVSSSLRSLPRFSKLKSIK